MAETVQGRLSAKVDSGELTADPSQLALARKLDSLRQALADQGPLSKKSALGWLMARGAKPQPPRGLYIWGGVGRGKTMLMDLFFEAAPVMQKRRVHFHAFMGEVHDRIAEFRAKLKAGTVQGDDPIEPVAATIAAETRLLCFDEFTVNDIADAMILGRLFEQLFARSLCVVATSNIPPEELYREGLNRALFLPFIHMLTERMEVVHLEAGRDYRLEAGGASRRYVTPLGPGAEACLAAHFRRLTGLEHGRRREIVHKGRAIVVPEAAGSVARFGFADLCDLPLGAGDYLKIAGSFDTIILSDVPRLGPESRNQAKRFINLIDTLYDSHIRLIVSAEAEPDDLWQGSGGVESFEFARTASRLTEMRSDDYWEAVPDLRIRTARAG